MKSLAVSFVLAFAFAFAIVSFLLSPARADDRGDAIAVTVAAVVFAKEECDRITPNAPMMAARFAELGITDADQVPERRLRQAALYRARMSSSPRIACKALEDNFGPNGSQIPGLFDRR